MSNQGFLGGAKANPALRHSFIGYNTIGQQQETTTRWRSYSKQITVNKEGLIVSIGAYIVQFVDAVFSFGAYLNQDRQNAVGAVIGAHVPPSAETNPFPGIVMETTNSPLVFGPPRWLHFPIGVWVTPGKYWLTVGMATGSSGGTTGQELKIYYDNGGRDIYFTSTVINADDGGRVTQNASGKNYSIRASFLSG